MALNKLFLLGNLTKDPNAGQTQSGTYICRFTIAVNNNYQATDGSQRNDPCFVDCICFGKVAENVGKYFGKGKPILVEGKLKTETWEDKTTNQKRSKLVVVMERFDFVGGGKTETSKHTTQATTAQAQDVEDDDVPF